jgi:hypothetical protein
VRGGLWPVEVSTNIPKDMVVFINEVAREHARFAVSVYSTSIRHKQAQHFGDNSDLRNMNGLPGSLACISNPSMD